METDFKYDINHEVIELYLKNTGWKIYNGNHISKIYNKTIGDKTTQIVLLCDKRIPSYFYEMRHTVRILASLENRNENELIRDIKSIVKISYTDFTNEDIELYLKNTGWIRTNSKFTDVDVYRCNGEEIIIPIVKDLEEYEYLIKKAVKKLLRFKNNDNKELIKCISLEELKQKRKFLITKMNNLIDKPFFLLRKSLKKEVQRIDDQLDSIDLEILNRRKKYDKGEYMKDYEIRLAKDITHYIIEIFDKFPRIKLDINKIAKNLGFELSPSKSVSIKTVEYFNDNIFLYNKYLNEDTLIYVCLIKFTLKLIERSDDRYSCKELYKKLMESIETK